MRLNARAVVLAAVAIGCSTARPTGAPSPTGGAAGGATPILQLTRGNMRQTIDSMVNDPQFRSALWGILIVDPEAGDTLYSHNASKLLIPASNQKLVVSSVLLTLMGPDYRFRTTFTAQGPVIEGTLNGDLGVIGRGDPTVSARARGDAMVPLREIADSLWKHGIRRITGSVVEVGNAFPGPAAGSSWPWDGLDGSSYAGVDELLFNEGLMTIRVRPGAKAGDPPIVTTAPAKTYPRVRILATTVPRDTTIVAQAGTGRGGATGRGGGGGRGGRGSSATRVDVSKDSGSTDIIVRGQIAIGDSANVTITQSDPDQAYVAALTEVLRERGIVVESQASPLPPGPVRGDSVFTVQSAPLSEVLAHLMKPSQNAIAEIFLRTIGLESGGPGTEAAGRTAIQKQFEAWKIPADGYVVRDGSGLSRSDLISNEAVIGILETMRRSPNFKVFYESLPIAGVDGTIRTRMQNTPAQGNLRAKTGTLSMVRSLSGYVTTADGRLLEFSMLCNNWTTPQAAVDRVQDAIGAGLASMRLR